VTAGYCRRKPSTRLRALVDISGPLPSNGADDERAQAMGTVRQAKFAVGQVVRHRFYPFRGVIFDIDPEFDNTEEWWLSIPEQIRPHKKQPFYHLLAENAETEYIAYVSEQNLLPDESGQPLRHPQLTELFTEDENGGYRAIFLQSH
jgi:heat shock protein HspQ